MEKLKEYLDGEIRGVLRELYNIQSMEKQAATASFEAASHSRLALYRAKTIIELLDANPDVAAEQDPKYIDMLRKDYRYHQHEFDENPVERLLSWSPMGNKQSFILGDELFEFLGKEDYRTFRALLRAVVQKVDPVKAQDF